MDFFSWSDWVRSAPGGLHFLAALGALLLGIVVLKQPKGTTRHRVLGSIWVLLMMIINTSAFTMYDIAGRPNLFHFFAVVSFVTVAFGYVSIRRYALTGDARYLVNHRIYMTWGYFGLASAGAWQVIMRMLVEMELRFSYGLVLGTLIALTILAGVLLNRYLMQRVSAGVA